MNKAELKLVTDEYRQGKHYPEIDLEPIIGIGLPDFEKGKFIRKEVIVNFLNWQCLFLSGETDENELSNCLFLLNKKVIMI
jgi:hypothetical protein